MVDSMSDIGILFPGQGSQYLGMLKNIALEYPKVLEEFQIAEDTLSLSLWEIAQNDSDKINSTLITQPLMLTANAAIYKLLQDLGMPEPKAVAGHSLGEYSALVAAGVLSFTDVLKLVALRAKLMAAAIPPEQGKMAAILGLSADVVEQSCAQVAKEHGFVAVANYNSSKQTVIAGNSAAVNEACAIAKESGAKRAILLPVSVPAHCELMQPVVDELAQFVATLNFSAPKIPIVQNLAGRVYSEIDLIRDALLKQVSQPVQWVATLNTMSLDLGIGTVIECGPQRVLTNLAKRSSLNFNCFATDTIDDIKLLANSFGR